LSIHREEIKQQFAIPNPNEFAEDEEPVSKMSFQFVEKRRALPKAFKSEISFHAKVKGVPSEV
jgi:hypothetical protein